MDNQFGEELSTNLQPLLNNQQPVNDSSFSIQPSQTSILRHDDNILERKPRQDCYGNKITPKSKAHRLKFKKELKQVHIVENWKAYNEDVTNAGCKCPCNLI